MNRQKHCFLFPFIFAFAFLAATGIIAAPAAFSAERIYIDVIKAPRRLPIAIMDLSGPQGKELSDIIREDLDFSGLFEPIPSEAFLESPTEPFNGSNWAGTGAEAVVKGTVNVTDKLHMVITLYDVFNGKLLMERKYSADLSLKRQLAHAAANDIYREITGQESMFRSKIAYLTQSGSGQRMSVSDWDGERAKDLGLRANVLTAPHWSPDATSLVYSAQRRKGWAVYQLSFKERKERRIMGGDGLNLAGDFFPDGETIAVSASRKGSPDIYKLNIRKRTLKRLTSDRSIEVSPSVSPDGSLIAYVSDRGGNPQIYTMDNFGYNKSRLTYEGKYNTSPVWSPVGDLLAFSGRHKGKNQIFIIRPDGTDLRLLTNEGNNEEPTFSPDGRFIAFTSDRDGSKSVYIMRTNGEGQKRITNKGVKAFAPRWSPK